MGNWHDGPAKTTFMTNPCLNYCFKVETGVDELLFNLVILRSLVNSEGVVWQAKQTQYYIIECMPLVDKVNIKAKIMLQIFDLVSC